MEQSSNQIVGVSFRLFTESDAKKLSVLSITNPTTFDSLGHPFDNGLADTALGPLKRNDFCKTCGLTDQQCLGHFGHISLPLPVFNPVFIQQLQLLLRMVCFNCHHFLVPRFNIEIYIAKLRALNLGLDYILDTIEEYARCLGEAHIGFEWDSTEGETFLRGKLNEMINSEFKQINHNKLKQDEDEKCCEIAQLEYMKVMNSKNVIEKKQLLMKKFFSGKLCKPAKACARCRSKKIGISMVNKSSMILSASRAAKSVRKLDKTIDGNEKDTSAINIEMKGKCYLTPAQVREHLREVWANEKETLVRIFPFIDMDPEELKSENVSCPLDIFFWETILAPPNRFRPLRFMNGRSFEHPQTTALSEIMLLTQTVSMALKTAKQTSSGETIARFHANWQRLQILCNRLYDSQMDHLPDNKAVGVKQILEKKEGLLRKNMMGKRVNFAARSVISPDPYIMVDEIGVPVVFATRLSFPQPVTNWNMARLQQMIINGPEKWPGAISVTYEDGFTVRLKPNDVNQRQSVAATLVRGSFGGPLSGVKVVNRHLINGDVMLLNRQPTLHKPSIMAHKARVLPKEKTLRLHYANCKCYNADFDGDEMNAHFPQSELARSEAYQIASVNKQFLIPKDGSPLSGLIQDHIVAGVMLSVRGRFFNKSDYQALVYGALSFMAKQIKLLPPTILKPQLLWSGKQIISTLVINLVPPAKDPPSFEIEAKISAKSLTLDKKRDWLAGGTPFKSATDMCESWIIFNRGELLSGIMDKVSFGANKNGLIHVCYELYGGDVHTQLLTAFARLSTNYLQSFSGFTLGIQDILVRAKPNQKRRNLIAASGVIGKKAVVDAFGLGNDFHDAQTIPEDVVLDKLTFAHTSKNDFHMKQLDSAYKQQTDSLANQISSACLPKGLVKPFPRNNLQMMIQSGAKGGSVNAIQISCLLGQIELEGRRIPLMMSGRTLPSFQPYDISPRAGGFVTGRFLTGIRPQEFFFHCMAGREGLIDTAVKTSRSGYLQRCLIKHLEGLVVNYDLTVRDAEGSVIQWLYGEDGIDVIKSQSLKQGFFPTIVKNDKSFRPDQDELDKLAMARDSRLERELEKMKKVDKSKATGLVMPFDCFQKQIKKKDNFSGDELKQAWHGLDEKTKLGYKTKSTMSSGDPIIARFRPDINVGAISESLDKVIRNYLASAKTVDAQDFRTLINTRYMKALANPGEAVGLLAAQSIGEPSTQMTLNTFHFAGRGEMNVTLGVPRLRELLMTASSNISTPSMDIPIRVDLHMNAAEIEAQAEQVRLKLNAVRLKDVLEYVDVIENVQVDENVLNDRHRVYRIRFHFLPKSFYTPKSFTRPAAILRFMESAFIKQLLRSVNARIRLLNKSAGLFDTKTFTRFSNKLDETNDDGELALAKNGEADENEASNKLTLADDDNDDDDDLNDEDLDVEVGEGDTTAMRHRSRLNQEQEYEEADEEEREADEDELNDEESQDEDAVTGDGKKKARDLDIKLELDEDSQHIPLEETFSSKKNVASSQFTEQQIKARKQHVLDQSGCITDYTFDDHKLLWCEVVLRFELIANKLDMRSIIEDEADKAFIHRVDKITRAFLVKDNAAAQNGIEFAQMIKTEGVSIPHVVAFENILDLKRIYTNDMHAIANTYGIEAARAALIREITNVFSVYGISVDGRHLSLIADHMTFTGVIKGMNRGAMDGISPLQAMTFETTTSFLKNALLLNLHDDLQSPSSRLVIGRPTVAGTGLFETRLNPAAFGGLKKSEAKSKTSALESNTKRNSKAKKRSFVAASPAHSAGSDAASVASDDTGDSRFKMFSKFKDADLDEHVTPAKKIKIEFED